MKNLKSGNQRGKRMKKLVTEKNLNWKIDVKKIFVVQKIGVNRQIHLKKKILN